MVTGPQWTRPFHKVVIGGARERERENPDSWEINKKRIEWRLLQNLPAIGRLGRMMTTTTTKTTKTMKKTDDEEEERKGVSVKGECEGGR
jgi:hypothetical protein